MSKNNLKYIVIRDDDITPFTRRDMLEKLYEDLLKRGLPVNFSVIPHVSTDIRYDENSPYSPYKEFMRVEFSPIIPPEYRGKKLEKKFEENTELLSLMHSLCGKIEILQHGYDHNHTGRRNEFAIYDNELIVSKLTAGRQMIQQVFNIEPSFFVAPRDSISFVTLKALKQKFKGISLWRFNPLKSALGEIKRKFLPRVVYDNFKALSKIKEAQNGVFRWDDFIILEHPGYIFNRFAGPDEIEKNFLKVLHTSEIIIIVNHHWEYFFDWNGLDEDLFRTWKKMANFVLERDNCKIVTFSQLYEVLTR